MLIEVNGTADPAELIEILAADRAGDRYTLPIQVSVIDASRWQRRHWQNGLEAQQAMTATHIVLSRAEEVDKERRGHVERQLGEVAPGAGLVEPDGLGEAIAELVDAPDLAPRRFDSAASDHVHDPNRHHFSAAELPLASVVERATLEAWLRGLPPEAVRVKGVAQLAGDDGWCYFERVGGADGVSIFSVRARSLAPVAIVIGPRLPAELDADRMVSASP